MRSKEDAHDYRYFPEPDLVPVEPSKEWVKEIKDSLGELPQTRILRLEKDFKLPSYEANLLVSNKSMADFFEECAKLHKDYKAIANWIVGELTAYLKDKKKTIKELDFTPAKLVEMLNLIANNTISGKIAKTVLVKVLDTGKSVKDVIAESGLTQISSEDELKKIVREVLKSNPKPVEEYKAGKKTAVGFLVGQLMKATKGRANPKLANKLLKDELEGG